MSTDKLSVDAEAYDMNDVGDVTPGEKGSFESEPRQMGVDSEALDENLHSVEAAGHDAAHEEGLQPQMYVVQGRAIDGEMYPGENRSFSNSSLAANDAKEATPSSAAAGNSEPSSVAEIEERSIGSQQSADIKRVVEGALHEPTSSDEVESSSYEQAVRSVPAVREAQSGRGGTISITLHSTKGDHDAEVYVRNVSNPDHVVEQMLEKLTQKFPPETVVTIAPGQYYGKDSSMGGSSVTSSVASSDSQATNKIFIRQDGSICVPAGTLTITCPDGTTMTVSCAAIISPASTITFVGADGNEVILPAGATACFSGPDGVSFNVSSDGRVTGTAVQTSADRQTATIADGVTTLIGPDGAIHTVKGTTTVIGPNKVARILTSDGQLLFPGGSAGMARSVAADGTTVTLDKDGRVQGKPLIIGADGRVIFLGGEKPSFPGGQITSAAMYIATVVGSDEHGPPKALHGATVLVSGDTGKAVVVADDGMPVRLGTRATAVAPDGISVTIRADGTVAGSKSVSSSDMQNVKLSGAKALVVGFDGNHRVYERTTLKVTPDGKAKLMTKSGKPINVKGIATCRAEDDATIIVGPDGFVVGRALLMSRDGKLVRTATACARPPAAYSKRPALQIASLSLAYPDGHTETIEGLVIAVDNKTGNSVIVDLEGKRVNVDTWGTAVAVDGTRLIVDPRGRVSGSGFEVSPDRKMATIHDARALLIQEDFATDTTIDGITARIHRDGKAELLQGWQPVDAGRLTTLLGPDGTKITIGPEGFVTCRTIVACSKGSIFSIGDDRRAAISSAADGRSSTINAAVSIMRHPHEQNVRTVLHGSTAFVDSFGNVSIIDTDGKRANMSEGASVFNPMGTSLTIAGSGKVTGTDIQISPDGRTAVIPYGTTTVVGFDGEFATHVGSTTTIGPDGRALITSAQGEPLHIRGVGTTFARDGTKIAIDTEGFVAGKVVVVGADGGVFVMGTDRAMGATTLRLAGATTTATTTTSTSSVGPDITTDGTMRDVMGMGAQMFQAQRCGVLYGGVTTTIGKDGSRNTVFGTSMIVYSGGLAYILGPDFSPLVIDGSAKTAFVDGTTISVDGHYQVTGADVKVDVSGTAIMEHAHVTLWPASGDASAAVSFGHATAHVFPGGAVHVTDASGRPIQIEHTATIVTPDGSAVTVAASKEGVKVVGRTVIFGRDKELRLIGVDRPIGITEVDTDRQVVVLHGAVVIANGQTMLGATVTVAHDGKVSIVGPNGEVKLAERTYVSAPNGTFIAARGDTGTLTGLELKQKHGVVSAKGCSVTLCRGAELVHLKNCRIAVILETAAVELVSADGEELKDYLAAVVRCRDGTIIRLSKGGRICGNTLLLHKSGQRLVQLIDNGLASPTLYAAEGATVLHGVTFTTSNTDGAQVTLHGMSAVVDSASGALALIGAAGHVSTVREPSSLSSADGAMTMVTADQTLPASTWTMEGDSLVRTGCRVTVSSSARRSGSQFQNITVKVAPDGLVTMQPAAGGEAYIELGQDVATVECPDGPVFAVAADFVMPGREYVVGKPLINVAGHGVRILGHGRRGIVRDEVFRDLSRVTEVTGLLVVKGDNGLGTPLGRGYSLVVTYDGATMLVDANQNEQTTLRDYALYALDGTRFTIVDARLAGRTLPGISVYPLWAEMLFGRTRGVAVGQGAAAGFSEFGKVVTTTTMTNGDTLTSAALLTGGGLATVNYPASTVVQTSTGYRVPEVVKEPLHQAGLLSTPGGAYFSTVQTASGSGGPYTTYTPAQQMPTVTISGPAGSSYAAPIRGQMPTTTGSRVTVGAPGQQTEYSSYRTTSLQQQQGAGTQQTAYAPTTMTQQPQQQQQQQQQVGYLQPGQQGGYSSTVQRTTYPSGSQHTGYVVSTEQQRTGYSAATQQALQQPRQFSTTAQQQATLSYPQGGYSSVVTQLGGSSVGSPSFADFSKAVKGSGAGEVSGLTTGRLSTAASSVVSERVVSSTVVGGDVQSTSGGRKEEVRYVEVPVIEDVVVEVPREEVVEVEKRVEVEVVQWEETPVYKEVIEYVDKVEEVEDIRYVVKEVEKPEIIEVDRPIYKEVEVVHEVEKKVQVPVEEVKVREVEVEVENAVYVPNAAEKEVATVVAQKVQATVEFDSVPVNIAMKTYEPNLVAVDVFVPVPVRTPVVSVAKVEEHHVVEVPSSHWNSLVKTLNAAEVTGVASEFSQTFLPYARAADGSLSMLPLGERIDIVPPMTTDWEDTRIKGKYYVEAGFRVTSLQEATSSVQQTLIQRSRTEAAKRSTSAMTTQGYTGHIGAVNTTGMSQFQATGGVTISENHYNKGSAHLQSVDLEAVSQPMRAQSNSSRFKPQQAGSYVVSAGESTTTFGVPPSMPTFGAEAASRHLGALPTNKGVVERQQQYTTTSTTYINGVPQQQYSSSSYATSVPQQQQYSSNSYTTSVPQQQQYSSSSYTTSVPQQQYSSSSYTDGVTSGSRFVQRVVSGPSASNRYQINANPSTTFPAPMIMGAPRVN